MWRNIMSDRNIRKPWSFVEENLKSHGIWPYVAMAWNGENCTLFAPRNLTIVYLPKSSFAENGSIE